jgi:transposase
MSISKMADLFNTTRPTIRNWLKKNNIETKDHSSMMLEWQESRNASKPSEEQLLSDYKNMSLKELQAK